MKTEAFIEDEIALLRQNIKLHEKTLTAVDVMQKGARINGLLWVLEKMPESVVTLSETPKIEQIIDAVHKE